MDFTKRNKIRDKDYPKISKDISRFLFRTDIESIYKEMIIDKELNKQECNLIRRFFEDIVINGERTGIKKTSYYHIALELYNKVKLENNNIHTWDKITKENKLNINEVIMLKVVLATHLSWDLLKASIF